MIFFSFCWVKFFVNSSVALYCIAALLKVLAPVKPQQKASSGALGSHFQSGLHMQTENMSTFCTSAGESNNVSLTICDHKHIIARD